MFSIYVHFLTGRVVAANVADPKQVEWPLHPARLYMAMVAAHYESDRSDEGRRVLEWIEQLPPPSIQAPIAAIRQTQTVFVPVNDKVRQPNSRSRQPRQFPSAFVGDVPLCFSWNEEVPSDLLPALQSLLANVVRIGHSSSLVLCSLETSYGPSGPSHAERWATVKWATGDSKRIRVVGAGTLANLDRDLNRAAVDEYGDLKLLERDSQEKSEQREAKAALSERFPNGLPISRPTSIGTTAIYQRVNHHVATYSIARSHFDSVLITMTKMEGSSLGLESTLLVCGMLRKAILASCGGGAPTWITGHDADGGATSKTHMAIVPLPFVGNRVRREGFANSSHREYADGHLMGLGIVLPRDLADYDKASGLGRFLVDDMGQPNRCTLTLGTNGTWQIERETRFRPPLALMPETWSQANSRPSHLWATVTPIVLDRHPKSDRKRNLAVWRSEVTQMVAQSCEHIGLPAPRTVRIEKHGFLAGVPSSRPGHSGFPLMKHSDGKTQRIQTHALLEFESPVQGPVLLGAGRFRGYGFCKPIQA